MFFNVTDMTSEMLSFVLAGQKIPALILADESTMDALNASSAGRRYNEQLQNKWDRARRMDAHRARLGR